MSNPLPEKFEYRLELSKHVTSQLLKVEPVHKWFYYPHSFSPQLVEILLNEWDLPKGALILDPFVGAGTTIYSANCLGFNAVGVDVSPLSVFISNTKAKVYNPQLIEQALQITLNDFRNSDKFNDLERTERLKRAFTDAEFAVLSKLRKIISIQEDRERDLLLLALLKVQQSVSRAKPDGGWFRWISRDCQAEQILPQFKNLIEKMISELPISRNSGLLCTAHKFDARYLNELWQLQPEIERGCQAIITSPPYPNRHDYSRIFQIELLSLGLSENDIFDLRHESLRSNVEAQAPQKEIPKFKKPKLLKDTISLLPQKADVRIKPMLLGYFEDMNSVMKSALDVLTPGGKLALVVGNVRHAGIMIPVDEILLSIGKSLGYEIQTSWVARLRGNSAQQMGKYGRQPARESVVILKKPDGKEVNS